jgi:hypothetical protein
MMQKQPTRTGNTTTARSEGFQTGDDFTADVIRRSCFISTESGVRLGWDFLVRFESRRFIGLQAATFEPIRVKTPEEKERCSRADDGPNGNEAVAVILHRENHG